MHSNFYKYTCEVLTPCGLTEQPVQSCKGWVLLPVLAVRFWASPPAFLGPRFLVYKVGVIIAALLTHRFLRGHELQALCSAGEEAAKERPTEVRHLA